ncbi:MAG: hypothetical protein JWN66_545 [Sphingomonas bacterium]|uniref:hypothetical protein n=1 Tax=Sphingomonas bacterium TaxID=1895847 RepID=UPI00263885AE|nr:hypothetical protein [Sphingomonas bacterium]MDB5703429.1 hypothetical protein [Sphingomonas bacterium]
MKGIGIAIAVALGGAASPAMAQQAAPSAVVTGDATAGLVSQRALGEVHVVADPTLADGRLVLRIVVLNRGAAPAPFGPGDVSVAAVDGTQIALVPRATLLAEQGGEPGAAVTDETPQAHSAAALPVNGAGQTDVSGFSGGMGTTVAGVPQGAIDRSRRADPKAAAAVAALDAVLLKPMTLKPGAADGGQIVTTKLKRGKIASVIVTILFAGEDHRFDVVVPKR